MFTSFPTDDGEMNKVNQPWVPTMTGAVPRLFCFILDRFLLALIKDR